MAHPVSYFRDRPRPAADWLIPGWLKRRNTGFLIGEPKRACKSWLLLNLAWQLSGGKSVWGITHSKNGPQFVPSTPLRVVYFTQEDTEDDMQDRTTLLFNSGWEANDRLWIVPKNFQLSFDTAVGMGLIQAELDSVVTKAGPIDLVIFDPMRRMHYKSENESEVIADMWRKLNWMHERYNCGSIFSHHIVKPPKDTFSAFDVTSPFAARGSGDIYGGGDAFMNVNPRATQGQTPDYRVVDIHFETKRDRPLSPISVKIDFKTGESKFIGYLQGTKGRTDAPQGNQEQSRA